MSLHTGLRVDYACLSADALVRPSEVLGIATFDGGDDSDGGIASLAVTDGIPHVAVGAPLLGSGSSICEIWRTTQPIESGRRASIQYRRSETLLFGCMTLHEAHFLQQSHQENSSELHVATKVAYQEIFATLDELAYPHLLRVWNYIPSINTETHGVERYRQFNSARREVLLACARAVGGNVPAACALGLGKDQPLVVYFLASREAPILVENPRQVRAYEYPSQYGPKPAFSRASVLREPTGTMLFMSGTASIVGHRSIHLGDVEAQTRETLRNIEALLNAANQAAGAALFDLASLAYKVYVRHEAQQPLIQAQLHSILGPKVRIVYLRADVCRQDLLVEIEAVGQGAPVPEKGAVHAAI